MKTERRESRSGGLKKNLNFFKGNNFLGLNFYRCIRKSGYRNSFLTIIELLIVIAIILILSGLLFPALKNSRKSAHRIQCINNQKQIGIGFEMYTSDYAGWWVFFVQNEFGSPSSKNPNKLWQKGFYMLGYAQKSNRVGINEFNQTCPSRTLELVTGDALTHGDYLMNFNDTWGYGGGGLGGAVNGGSEINRFTGCRNTQIPNPSQFITLADRASRGAQKFIYAYPWLKYGIELSQPSTPDGRAYLNPYVHTGGGNYLNADGHVAWISWKQLNYGMFLLRPNESSIRNYNCWP